MRRLLRPIPFTVPVPSTGGSRHFPGALPGGDGYSSGVGGWLSSQTLDHLPAVPVHKTLTAPHSWHGGERGSVEQSSPFLSANNSHSGSVQIDLVVIEGSEGGSSSRRMQGALGSPLATSPPEERKKVPGSGGPHSKMPSLFSRGSKSQSPAGGGGKEFGKMGLGTDTGPELHAQAGMSHQALGTVIRGEVAL